MVGEEVLEILNNGATRQGETWVFTTKEKVSRGVRWYEKIGWGEVVDILKSLKGGKAPRPMRR